MTHEDFSITYFQGRQQAVEVVQARGLSHCFANDAIAMQDKQKTAGFFSFIVTLLAF